MSKNWADCTVISQSELEDRILESGKEQDKEISVHSYHIGLNSKGNFSEDKLLKYVGEQFPKFVLSQEEREERSEKEKHDHARDVGRFMDIFREGKYGEILLFLLLEGFFDIPVVCHKVSARQSWDHEVKGSDGLFYGKYKGREVLGVGEAKFYSSNLNTALTKGIESVDEFHSDESKRKWNEDLKIASKTIHEENFTKEQVKTLQKIFDGGKEEAEILHPIFVGYENKDKLQEIQINSDEKTEAEEKLEKLIEDEERLETAKDKVKDKANRLRKHTLLFLFLPVEDAKEFKMKMSKELYPGSQNLIEKEFERRS